MSVQDLPKWTHANPALLGVGISFVGMNVFPMLGLRNTLGPILGLSTAMLLGVGLLAVVARLRST